MCHVLPVAAPFFRPKYLFTRTTASERHRAWRTSMARCRAAPRTRCAAELGTARGLETPMSCRVNTILVSPWAPRRSTTRRSMLYAGTVETSRSTNGARQRVATTSFRIPSFLQINAPVPRRWNPFVPGVCPTAADAARAEFSPHALRNPSRARTTAPGAAQFASLVAIPAGWGPALCYSETLTGARVAIDWSAARSSLSVSRPCCQPARGLLPLRTQSMKCAASVG
jgi:hypothetical protein